MPNTVDLGELGSLGSTIIGEFSHVQTGLSLSAAGDVNGDGIDDVIIGGAVQAYVVFGREGGIGEIDLFELQPSEGFEIDFDLWGLVPGPSVAGAGDINGDGFDDIIVGGYQYGVGQNYGIIPNAYVIFGKAEEFDRIYVSDFYESATPTGFRMFDEFTYDSGPRFSGATVASAGDFNGDGFDDMIVGNPFHDGNTGAAHIIFGQASGFENIDLTNLDPATGFSIIGETPGDQLGLSISGAGDVNGDGFDDIIIGAPFGNEGGEDSGQAYVIFGRQTGFGTIDLSNLDTETGFIIKGDGTFGSAGWSVSAAGDVNGDGLDDLIVGAPYAEGKAGNTAATGAGEAYVIFGKADDFGTIDLSRLKPQDGFTIKGDDAGDLAGWSVSGAGDLNADGFDEIIVGAPSGDGGGADAGEAYVIFGRAHGFRTIDLARIEDGNGRGRSEGFIIQGDIANDRAGWSVSEAGDVDGDGVDDLIVAAPWNDLGAIGDPPGGFPTAPEDLNSGLVYVLYGAELNEFLDSRHGHGQGQGNAHFDLI